MDEDTRKLVVGGLRDPSPEIRKIWIEYLNKRDEIYARRDEGIRVGKFLEWAPWFMIALTLALILFGVPATHP